MSRTTTEMPPPVTTRSSSATLAVKLTFGKGMWQCAPWQPGQRTMLGDTVNFETERECTLIFQNCAFFHKTYIHLFPNEPQSLVVKDNQESTDFVIFDAELVNARIPGNPPPIT